MNVKIHPTGVTAVGVRMPLVAFNVNLGTDDLEIANSISKIIRGSSGGYKILVKTIGVMLEDRNITKFLSTWSTWKNSHCIVVETVRFEAQRYGVRIIGTELHRTCSLLRL